jgi:hypothetical protein
VRVSGACWARCPTCTAVCIGSILECAGCASCADLRWYQCTHLLCRRRDLYSTIAAELQRVLGLAGKPIPEAVAVLGRNCHMPNALTSPLHVVLHMEARAAAAVCAGQRSVAPAGADGGRDGCAADQASGGEQQPPPGGPQGGANQALGPPAAGGAAEAVLRELSGRRWYVAGVRAAAREGGCCASRASYVGAVLGALQGHPAASPASPACSSGTTMRGLPAAWLAKYSTASEVERLARRLCADREAAAC